MYNKAVPDDETAIEWLRGTSTAAPVRHSPQPKRFSAASPPRKISQTSFNSGANHNRPTYQRDTRIPGCYPSILSIGAQSSRLKYLRQHSFEKYRALVYW